MKNGMLMLFTLFLLLSLMVAGCASQQNNSQQQESKRASVMKISAQEAKKRLDAENGIILVDVRTVEEFNDQHIKNSVLLPLDTISDKAGTVIPDKEAVYFIYCRSGNRSATATAMLSQMGYKNLYDLGGIIDWPYEKEKGQPNK